MKLGFAAPLAVEVLRPWLDVPLPDTLPRGQGSQSTSILLDQLLQLGQPIVAVTLDTDLITPRSFSGELLTLHVLPSRSARRSRDYFHAERSAIAATLAREDPAVIGAHWTYEFALGSLQTGIPTSVWVRDWAPSVLRLMPVRTAPFWAVHTVMQAQSIHRADHLIASSPEIAHRIARWYRRAPDVVPNGFADSLFDGPAPRVTHEPPRILSAANGFNRLKNTANLLTAFSAVRGSFPGATLTLAGVDHEPDGPAHRWACRRGLDASVEFRGATDHDDLLVLMEEATLFVHPSRHESFGNVLVEAMSRGTPVMGGRHSGAVPWVLDDGRAGLLTDVDQPTTMARDIVQALTDPETLAQVGGSGRAHADRQFRLSRTADRYLEILDRVAAGHIR